MKFFTYTFKKPQSSQKIAEQLQKVIEATSGYDRKSEMMLFALIPQLSLEYVLQNVDRQYVKIGPMDVAQTRGNFIAGQTTLDELVALDVDVIQLGSLERRIQLKETDTAIEEKLLDILQRGLKSMVCVGETEQEKEQELTQQVLVRQLESAFQNIPKDSYYRCGPTYQPMWAITEKRIELSATFLSEQLACIHKTLARLLPEAPESLAVFLSGNIETSVAIQALKTGGWDGFVMDDCHWTPEELLTVIKETMSY